MSKKIILYFFLEEILSITTMGVALFWSAGRFDWWPGWAAVAIWLVWFTATDILLLFFHPDLLIERLKPPQGAKVWDRAILTNLRLLQLVRYILAGLDQRYGWTGGFSLTAQIAALTVCIFSYTLLAWAMASNKFFSQIVRIQSNRDHTVASSGPYRYLRHPGYTGMILFELAMGILLASWWALLAGGLCAILLIVRTVLEDRTLLAELSGYVDYSRQVRYRLLPGVW